LCLFAAKASYDCRSFLEERNDLHPLPFYFSETTTCSIVGGSGWIVLCTDTKTIDLLSLTGGRFAPLCSRAAADGGIEELPIEVPAGNISQVRLHLLNAQLVFNDGTPTADVKVPSGSTSGLKIDVNQSVPKGGTLEIKLDFDAAQSIHKLGNGAYLMQPVIRVLP